MVSKLLKLKRIRNLRQFSRYDSNKLHEFFCLTALSHSIMTGLSNKVFTGGPIFMRTSPAFGGKSKQFYWLDFTSNVTQSLLPRTRVRLSVFPFSNPYTRVARYKPLKKNFEQSLFYPISNWRVRSGKSRVVLIDKLELLLSEIWKQQAEVRFPLWRYRRFISSYSKKLLEPPLADTISFETEFSLLVFSFFNVLQLYPVTLFSTSLTNILSWNSWLDLLDKPWTFLFNDEWEEIQDDQFVFFDSEMKDFNYPFESFKNFSKKWSEVTPSFYIFVLLYCYYLVRNNVRVNSVTSLINKLQIEFKPKGFLPTCVPVSNYDYYDDFFIDFDGDAQEDITEDIWDSKSQGEKTRYSEGIGGFLFRESKFLTFWFGHFLIFNFFLNFFFKFPNYSWNKSINRDFLSVKFLLSEFKIKLSGLLYYNRFGFFVLNRPLNVENFNCINLLSVDLYKKYFLYNNIKRPVILFLFLFKLFNKFLIIWFYELGGLSNKHVLSYFFTIKVSLVMGFFRSFFKKPFFFLKFLLNVIASCKLSASLYKFVFEVYFVGHSVFQLFLLQNYYYSLKMILNQIFDNFKFLNYLILPLVGFLILQFCTPFLVIFCLLALISTWFFIGSASKFSRTTFSSINIEANIKALAPWFLVIEFRKFLSYDALYLIFNLIVRFFFLFNLLVLRVSLRPRLNFYFNIFAARPIKWLVFFFKKFTDSAIFFKKNDFSFFELILFQHNEFINKWSTIKKLRFEFLPLLSNWQLTRFIDWLWGYRILIFYIYGYAGWWVSRVNGDFIKEKIWLTSLYTNQIIYYTYVIKVNSPLFSTKIIGNKFLYRSLYLYGSYLIEIFIFRLSYLNFSSIRRIANYTTNHSGWFNKLFCNARGLINSELFANFKLKNIFVTKYLLTNAYLSLPIFNVGVRGITLPEAKIFLMFKKILKFGSLIIFLAVTRFLTFFFVLLSGVLLVLQRLMLVILFLSAQVALYIMWFFIAVNFFIKLLPIIYVAFYPILFFSLTISICLYVIYSVLEKFKRTWGVRLFYFF